MITDNSKFRIQNAEVDHRLRQVNTDNAECGMQNSAVRGEDGKWKMENGELTTNYTKRHEKVSGIRYLSSSVILNLIQNLLDRFNRINSRMDFVIARSE